VIVEEPVPEAEAEREEILIKRVIGLPGETVQIKDGVVLIDGRPLREQQADGGYLIEETNCYGGKLCEPYVIPVAHIVVMGDHRSNSLDSRSWGADPGLPLDRVVGKAWVSYWPRSEWGFIPMPTYTAAVSQ
jgi:signal peptidase I